MTIAKRLVNTLAGILLIVSIVYAQEQQNNANSSRSAATITASAAVDRVRFTAPSSVVQMRLEVYNANGEKVFDNEIRGGNVIDWLLQNGQAERLSDGSYLCVITGKSLSGRISQRVGSVTLANAAASLQPVDSAQLTAKQSEAVGPLEENASLTVLKEGETHTPTVIAHNGDEGQITRGRGALSFRIGDFYSGKDTEQMRLTAEGNLGIGITNPQVRLDVDGVIRASQGIIFPDGTTQFSAASKTLGARSTRPDQNTGSTGSKREFQTQAAGTGTQNFLAKWLDNSGNLGDSIIFETSNNVGIGTPSPFSKTTILGTATGSPSSTDAIFKVDSTATNALVMGALTGLPFATYIQSGGSGTYPLSLNPNGGNVGIGTTSPLSNTTILGTATSSPSSTNAIFKVDSTATNALVMGALISPPFAMYVQSGGSGTYPLSLNPNGGNVGVGTTSPQAKLDVAGDMMVAGNAVIAGNIAAKYQDVAEWVPSRQKLAAGTVVSLDVTRTNTVTPSARPYDPHIAGVVSSQPGIILGEGGPGKVLVATTGRVKVKVDATRHPINIGDLLVTSDKSGLAMKSLPIKIAGTLIHRPGTIIGKALEPLSKGKGEILVLLSLQ